MLLPITTSPDLGRPEATAEREGEAGAGETRNTSPSRPAAPKESGPAESMPTCQSGEWKEAARRVGLSTSLIDGLPTWVAQPFPWCSMLRWTARAARLGVDVDITSLAAAGALDCLGTLLRPAEATRGQRAADPSSADSSTLCRQAATDLYRKHFQPKHTFWSLRDRLMLASARSIRWKHRLQTQKSMVITTPDVNRMAERYLVAAAAPTAAAFLARRARIAKLLEDLTLSLGCAATLLEDHDSLVPDLESQRSSAVLSDLSLCVSSQESLTLETICRNNEAREALLKNLQRTRLYLAAADSLADQLRMPEAKRHIADRRETVEAEMSRLAAFAGRRQP